MRHHLIPFLAVLALTSILPPLRVTRGGPAQAPVFLRGDANADGHVDLSDAVLTLSSLFLGTGNLPCADAADADDSGFLDISDAVSLLSYLFLGRQNLPQPFPQEGPDPSDDSLSCVAAERLAAVEALNQEILDAIQAEQEEEEPFFQALGEGIIEVSSELFDVLTSLKPGESLMDHLDVPGMPDFLLKLEEGAHDEPPADDTPVSESRDAETKENLCTCWWFLTKNAIPSLPRANLHWTRYRPDGSISEERRGASFHLDERPGTYLYQVSGPGARHNIKVERYRPNENTPRTSTSAVAAGGFRVRMNIGCFGKHKEMYTCEEKPLDTRAYIGAEYHGDLFIHTDEGLGDDERHIEALAQQEATFTVRHIDPKTKQFVVDEFFGAAMTVQNGTEIKKTTAYELQGELKASLTGINVGLNGSFYRRVEVKGRTGQASDRLDLVGVAVYDNSNQFPVFADLWAQGKAELDADNTTLGHAQAQTRRSMLLALALNKCNDDKLRARPLILHGGLDARRDDSKEDILNFFKSVVPTELDPEEAQRLFQEVTDLLWNKDAEPK